MSPPDGVIIADGRMPDDYANGFAGSFIVRSGYGSAGNRFGMAVNVGSFELLKASRCGFDLRVISIQHAYIIGFILSTVNRQMPIAAALEPTRDVATEISALRGIEHESSALHSRRGFVRPRLDR